MNPENLLQIFLTSVIQGITEFLPISSSGHILFLNKIFNWNDVNLTLVIAAHFGTLLAVIKYFWLDIKKYFIFGFVSFYKKNNNFEKRMLTNIFFSTLPIIVFGFILRIYPIKFLYSVPILIFATIFFAIILFISDRTKINKKIEDLTNFHALVIGFFQILALIPGASRAGVCISAARFLGFDRLISTKYSMYLSIPTISAASFIIIIDLINKTSSFYWIEIFIAFVLSFIFALVTIDFFLKILKKINLTFFAIYRIIISLLFIFIFY